MSTLPCRDGELLADLILVKRRLPEIALLIAGFQHAAILHHDAEPARKMELPQ